MTDSDDMFRRYEANQKVPYLPDDDDFDHALSELRTAVGEIALDVPYGVVSDVLRVLRQRRDLAAQVLDKQEPTCLVCGGDKKCLVDDEVRPEAKELATGWQLMSPLGRWETVERAEQTNDYGPVRVWTDKTGPDYSWLIPHWQHVDAIAPPLRWHGTPEIRVVELDHTRTSPMYAVITLDTIYRPAYRDPLVEAGYTHGRGWTVTHRPDGGGDPVVIRDLSKAKARTQLRAAARQHAKALGVKVADPARPPRPAQQPVVVR